MAEAEFNFEEFERRGALPPGPPYVTIQKRGTFSLNRGAVEALGEPEAVKLLFDPERRAIGFRAASLEDPNAYRLAKSRRAATWYFGGGAFVHRHGIPTGTARRYRAKVHNDGLVVVDLNEEPVATWPSKGAGQDEE